MVNYTLKNFIGNIASSFINTTIKGERGGRVISAQESEISSARIPEGSDGSQIQMIQRPCRMVMEQFDYDAEKGEFFVYYGGCKVNSNFNSIYWIINYDLCFREMQTCSTHLTV